MNLMRALRILCVALLALPARCVTQTQRLSCSCTCMPKPASKTTPRPSPSPTPKTTPASDVPDLYRAILEEHNALRKKHRAPPLTWDADLAKGAERWAHACVFEHDPNNTKHGENLFMAYGEPDPAKVLRSSLKAWYGEVNDYRYGSLSSGTGHFTQVVWKGSKRLGCSVHRCKPMRIVVCRYDPPGNVQGKTGANVLAPRDP